MLPSGPDGRRVDVSGHSLSFRRGVAGVRAMVEVGVERGVGVRECLRGTGIEPETLLGHAVVSRAQELAVATNLVAAAGQASGLGIAVGERLSLRTYGVWGFALLTSPTLRDAAELGLRYLPLTYAVAGLRMRVSGEEARLIVVDDHGCPAALRPFVVGREIAATAGILRTILGESPRSMRVELSLPRVCTGYEKALGTPVRFGAPGNAIVTDTAVLDLPLPQADPLTMAACERACRSLLRERCSPCVAQSVRAVIADGVTEACAVAARLHLSPRTLRRHLAAEGTSLRRLVDEARRASAIELMTTHRLGVEQVALRLGYTDAATFIRAFRRWTGTTPGAYPPS